MTAHNSPSLKSLGGEGPDCVLIHGLASDSTSWAANIPALLPHARLHAVDLPSHGRNLTLRMSSRLEENADAMLNVMLDANISSAHLVAHSLGGAIALALAATNPSAVTSLTLIAPVGLGQGADVNFMGSLIGANTEEEALAVLQHLFARPSLVNKIFATRFLDYLNNDSIRPSLRDICELIIQWERVDLPRLRRSIPQQIQKIAFWGESDRVNAPCAEFAAEAGFTLSIVPNAGHMPHIEHPRSIDRAIVSAIKASPTNQIVQQPSSP